MRKLVFFALAAAVFSVFQPTTTARADEPTKTVRIGVFDSRCIAVAYANSAHMAKKFDALKKRLDEAVVAKDEAKQNEIKAEGAAGQEKMHLQGFGTASVAELLADVKDKIPALAKEKGVNIIVSKWDITYQTPGSETVDVTDDLVQLFQPQENALKSIAELKKHPPISEAELRKMKD